MSASWDRYVAQAVDRPADATAVGPNRYLGDDAIADIIQRQRGGASVNSIASAYGISIRTVYRYLELAPRSVVAVATEQPRAPRRLIEVPVDLLDMGTNVRSERKSRAHADYGLAASIREHGVLQPITVVRRGKRFEVLYGHRRTAAARAAGLVTIPAVLETDPADKPLLQLVENEHRRRVDPAHILGRRLGQASEAAAATAQGVAS